MKRMVVMGLLGIMVMSVLVGCERPAVAADWFPETLSQEYLMDEEAYFSQDRAVESMELPEGIDVYLDGADVVWTQDGKTHALGSLPRNREWQKVAAVTQVGVVVQSDTGLWLVTPTGEVRNLQYIGADGISSYVIAEPYFYFYANRQLHCGRLDTGQTVPMTFLYGFSAVDEMRMHSNVDIEVRARAAKSEPVVFTYCRVNQKRYYISAIERPADYLKSRNADLRAAGIPLSDFRGTQPIALPLQPIEEAPPMWTPPMDMTDAEYLAVEREENSYSRQKDTYSVKHNQLYYSLTGAGTAPSLGDLGDGAWQTVGGENEVGQLLFEGVAGELWLYEKATGYRYLIGKVEAMRSGFEYKPYGPHYFIVCKNTVYRGSFLSNTLKEVCRKDEKETVLIWTNDLIQVFFGNGKSRVISNRTGREYWISVQMNGGWLESDWEELYRMRRADLDNMGITEEFFQAYERKWSEQ